jgi:hypothetical protein
LFVTVGNAHGIFATAKVKASASLSRNGLE